MKPVFIPGAGLYISAEVCADLRHGAVRDLAAARRIQEHVKADTAATVDLMDTIGAAWANKEVANVAADVARLDGPRCSPVDWPAMSVSEAATILKTSEQSVKGLLKRQTLHGLRGPRAWRVCAESVGARLKGAKCQHSNKEIHP